MVSEVWKFPLRLRNLSLLKTPAYKEGLAGTPFQELGHRGRCRLLKFLPPKGIELKKEALFITPSLINRYYILDLYSGCSFIEHLTDQGYVLYLIDWGEPRPQDRYATLEDHILNWLGWAFELSTDDFGKNHSGGKLHLFGQCIGGTFATVYATLNPTKIKSLILLTTPIDFHVEGAFQQWTQEGSVNIEEMAEVWGNIRYEFLNQTFKMLTPLGDLKQWQNLLKFGWNKSFVKKHAAITSWVNDNIHFPGATYKKFINDFYKENKLIKGTLTLGEEKIDLKKIKCPIKAFYAKGDIIVPQASTMALKDTYKEGQVEFEPLGGGHIGCVVSDRHQRVLWEKTRKWLNNFEAIN